MESNPGPKSNLSIKTYNCNGLENTDKSRRVLLKVVLLQETHIKNENIIKTLKTNCVHSGNAVAGKVTTKWFIRHGEPL